MILMEGVSENQTSKTLPIGVESMVAWLGVRLSSFFGSQFSQYQTKKLSGIVRKRMAALSLFDPIQYFQPQTVRALQVKIFSESVIYQRPQTMGAMCY